MTIATMAMMMKKIIKMIATTMFRFVIFRGDAGGRGERGGGNRKEVGRPMTRRSGREGRRR